MTGAMRNDDTVNEDPARAATGPRARDLPQLSEAYDLYQCHAYAEAEVVLRQAIAGEADDVHFRALLAACLFRRGLVTEALGEVEKALGLWADDPDLRALEDVLIQVLLQRFSERLAGQRLCT